MVRTEKVEVYKATVTFASARGNNTPGQIIQEMATS
jgi:hypothetical protein